MTAPLMRPRSCDSCSLEQAPGSSHAACAAASLPTASPTRIALVGIPNSGKSLLFQRLTGKYAATGNYPHTTSVPQEATGKSGLRDALLIDTPGISGLEFSSEDEAATRSILLDQPPDLLIVCIDAVNLVRSLVLAAQLAELEIPMVVALTLVDEALGRDVTIDCKILEKELGAPVVPVCAADGRGVRKLAATVAQARLPEKVAGAEAAARGEQLVGILLRKPDGRLPRPSISSSILDAHHRWASDVAAKAVRSSGFEPRHSFWTFLGDVSLHPVGSWAILLSLLVGIYLAVDRIGVGILAGGLDRTVVVPTVNAIARWAGPGIVGEILVGPYGLLSLGLFNALGTVLPILSVFYFLYGFLEDVGFFPQFSAQFDRLLRVVGLNGKAVLPITLGFGCNSVATMAARRLASPSQRFIACFLIALAVPCSVQLGVMVSIMSSIPATSMLGLIVVVVFLAALSGSVLARLLPAGEHDEFLVELPPFRAPSWRNIVAKTRHRLLEFLFEATPAFVLSAAVLLALNFTGLLDKVRAFMAPVVVRGLGLPREAADMLLVTLARREVGAVMMKDMVAKGSVSHKQIFVGLLVMTLFVPCMSNTMLLGRAVGWLRTFVIIVGVLAIAIGTGAVFNFAWI